MAVHLAVAGDVFFMSCFVLSFFPRYALDEIWDYFESVPEDFFLRTLKQGEHSYLTPKVFLSGSSINH